MAEALTTTTAQAAIDVIDAATAEPLPGIPLPEIEAPDPDPDEVFLYRFLCKRGGLVFVGPTGLGKSSFAMQGAITWAAGLSHFGIEPPRPLTTWIIQAENDAGDLAEERDGVLRGLAEGLVASHNQLAEAVERVRIVTETQRYGDEVGRWLSAELDNAGRQDALPDLVVIDPVFAFLGGDAMSQNDVTHFLRNVLNPVLHRHGVACWLNHHSNKPPKGADRSAKVYAGDLAYLGAGSAEWANWPRAVLALENTPETGVYKLHAAKRGKRLRWADEDGHSTLVRYIAHAREPGMIFWRDADPDETAAASRDGRSRQPKGPTYEDVAKLVTEPRTKTLWVCDVRDRLEIGRNAATSLLAAAVDAKLLEERQTRVYPTKKVLGPVGTTMAVVQQLEMAAKKPEQQELVPE